MSGWSRLLPLLLLCFLSANGFEVPPAWSEGITTLLTAAERGSFPHFSPDAQELYGHTQSITGQPPQVMYICTYAFFGNRSCNV